MDRNAFQAVFEPYVDRVDPQFSFLHLRTPDGGEADIYAGMQPDFDGMTITRFSAGQVLDLVVEFARAVDAVILPWVGRRASSTRLRSPTCPSRCAPMPDW